MNENGNAWKPILDALLGAATERVVGEGRNLLRIKTLGFSIQLVGGVRRLLIVQYAVMIACFTWALTFAGTVFALCLEFDRGGALHFGASAFHWVGAGMLALSTAVLWLSVREKTWLKALAIEEMIDQAMADAPRAVAPSAHDEISRLVSRLVEAKLASMAQPETTKPKEVA